MAVLDDQEGRKIARDRGLQVSGTIGLVIEAKYDGTVKSVREVLDKLIESGFWLDEELYHVILQEVDE